MCAACHGCQWFRGSANRSQMHGSGDWLPLNGRVPQKYVKWCCGFTEECRREPNSESRTLELVQLGKLYSATQALEGAAPAPGSQKPMVLLTCALTPGRTKEDNDLPNEAYFSGARESCRRVLGHSLAQRAARKVLDAPESGNLFPFVSCFASVEHACVAR